MKNMILVACFLLVDTAIQAATLRVEVSGLVSQVDPPFAGLVSVGEPMHGFFVYDSRLVTSVIEFAPGRTFHYQPLIEYELHLGSIMSSGFGGRAEVSNDHVDSLGRLWDRVIFETGGVSLPRIPILESRFAYDSLSTSFRFYDYDDANAVLGTALPSPLPLNEFDLTRSSASIHLLVPESGEWESIFGRIATAKISVVSEIPEVGGLNFVFLAVGVGALMARRRAPISE